MLSAQVGGGGGGGGGLGVLSAAVLLAGEMAGSGVLALPNAMIGTGQLNISFLVVTLSVSVSMYLCSTDKKSLHLSLPASQNLTPTSPKPLLLLTTLNISDFIIFDYRESVLLRIQRRSKYRKRTMDLPHTEYEVAVTKL